LSTPSKLDRLHRAILDKDVLRGRLPILARTAAHRSAQPDARERERRFVEASPSYANAIDDRESFAANAQKITVDSLTWWVPLVRPEDAALVERAVEHQDFPYRVITQTREVAIGGLMIDIGANNGRMCVPRAILGDVTAVYCAEPDPLNYTCLVRNVRDNDLRGIVLPDRLAIGSENGTVQFGRGRFSGGHRVIDAGKKTKHEVVEVESLTLDSWVARVGIDLGRLVFVKLDAQGSEVHVLRGAARTLASSSAAWQIEIDLPLLAKRGFQAEDLYGPLRQHFSHFVDLGRHARGDRVRSVGEMTDALSSVSGGSDGRTDILVFKLEPPDRRFPAVS
jgi:FkbM family methyltransferase